MRGRREADILRRVAVLAERYGLDGRTFPAAVNAAADPWGVRSTPESVRRLAALIRFRGGNLSASGVAAVLCAAARRVG